MLVAWDTLEAPTYRHEKFEAYQSGREFDAALLEQLDALPEFVAACGFANAKAPGYEADDFLAAATEPPVQESRRLQYCEGIGSRCDSATRHSHSRRLRPSQSSIRTKCRAM